jgi:NADPH:quinone reductase-like Zn-dependent oxidoreductase
MPVPTGVSIVDAAALPEVTCTVWSNLVTVAGLSRGESVLVHGGGSGIGTMAIQLASLVGARSFVTCGSQRKVDACLALGAEAGINYREQDWVDGLRAVTEGRGVDVILDVVGAKYLPANLRALSRGGRLVVIGLQGGRTGELDLGRMLTQRLSVHGTTLRSLSPSSKGEIVDAVVSNMWPALSSGEVRPVVDRVLPWTDVAEAHRVLEAGENIGKVLLRVGDSHGNGRERGDGPV